MGKNYCWGKRTVLFLKISSDVLRSVHLIHSMDWDTSRSICNEKKKKLPQNLCNCWGFFLQIFSLLWFYYYWHLAFGSFVFETADIKMVFKHLMKFREAYAGTHLSLWISNCFSYQNRESRMLKVLWRSPAADQLAATGDTAGLSVA